MTYKYARVSPEGLVLELIEADEQLVDITNHELRNSIQPEWTYKNKAFFEPKMTRYARLVEGTVVEIFELPETRSLEASFPAEIAQQIIPIGTQNVRQGHQYSEKHGFRAPPPPKKASPLDIRKAEFEKKWPVQLQIQVLFDKLDKNGQHSPLFDEFKKDRDELIAFEQTVRAETEGSSDA